MNPIPIELEELILCGCCRLPFNDTDLAPKLFSCRHYFCLKCTNTVLNKGTDLYCIHCWKRTELPGPDMKAENLPTHTSIIFLINSFHLSNWESNESTKKCKTNSTSSYVNTLSSVNANTLNKGENCLTHAMPNSLWCTNCKNVVCRGCASTEEHRNHPIKTHVEAKEEISSDIAMEILNMQKSLTEIQQLIFRQREFLMKILEACTSLKSQIESELIDHIPTYEIAEIRESLSNVKVRLSLLERQTPVEAFKLHCNINLEKQRMLAKLNEMLLKCKLDDIVRTCGTLLEYDTFKNTFSNMTLNDLASFPSSNSNTVQQNSMLLIANYCISQIYSRQIFTTKKVQIETEGNQSQNKTKLSELSSCSLSKGVFDNAFNISGEQSLPTGSVEFSLRTKTLNVSSFGQLIEPISVPKSFSGNHGSILNIYVPENGLVMQVPQKKHSINGSSPVGTTVSSVPVPLNQTPSLLCNPTVHVYPIYFFNIEINGQPYGRILIEVRNDVAPKMAKNFSALTTGELGFGYKGCTVFQCWENESIITGDFELNNGRGGRSAFEDGFFMPDDTKILAVRGSVGMRRSQKRHDNMGLVGSQFRIILREMRGFTGIFAFVVEGLDLVEKISKTGDSAGKPQSNVVIISCGKLQYG